VEQWAAGYWALVDAERRPSSYSSQEVRKPAYEVLEDGRNGLLVGAGDVDGLTAAIQRFFADEGLRERLREAAAGSVRRLAPDQIYPRYEAILQEAAR